MSTDVAIRQPALAIRPGQDFWTEKQRAALDVLGIKNASNADLAVFMHYCQKTGLDPFSRQIYMICRREKQADQWVDKQTIQVGIDGFRVIRDRVAAQLGVAVEYEDTVWYDDEGGPHKVWLWEEAPAACMVTVVKDGKRFPAVVRTASYMAMKDGNPVSQWRTQADHMIEKCAEAFALRRAFPHDLGGLYVEDELPPAEPAQPRPERVTVAEITGHQVALNVPPGPVATGSSDAENAGTPAPATSVSSAGPAGTQDTPHRAEAGKAAMARLETVTAQIMGDWTDADKNGVLCWLAGTKWTATTAQVRLVTGVLDDELKSADNDATAAAASLWAKYEKAQAG
jgi:phage recombination protein Bet